MNNRQLKHHNTLPNLTETQTDLGSPDNRQDGLNLPPDPTAIADPRIFMLPEAIKRTLDSSFAGLQSTLTAISTQMPMGPAVGSRLGHLPLLVLECPLAVIVPLLRRTAPHRPPANRGGGGGVFQIAGETCPRKMRTVIDAVSLLPVEEIPLPVMALKESKFRVYQDTITKTSLPSSLPAFQCHLP